MSADQDRPHHHHHLCWLPERFTVHRLESQAVLPALLLQATPVFVARTASELSVICSTELAVDSLRQQGPYRGLHVVGELDFDLVGVIARITAVLAAAKVSVLTVSTFQTDYVFVPEVLAEPAEVALTAAGYQVNGPAQS